MDKYMDKLDGIGIIRECLPPVDSYAYPVLTESMEIDDVFVKMEIPPKILKKLSTYELIQSILNHPLLTLDIVAGSNFRITNVRSIFSRMDCVRELERRPDCDMLVSFYREIDCPCVCNGLQDGDKTGILSKLSYFELLFTKPEISDRFTCEKKRELVTELLSKYEQKSACHGLMDGYLLGFTISAMAWTMYMDEYAPVLELYENDLSFKESFYTGDYSLENTTGILSIAHNFINNH
jgi:hypothetical protein